jgi:putative sterol carrier protein
MPTNAHELFDEQIPEALAKYPEKAKAVGAVYLFKITGEGGGEWLVDLKADPPTCKPGAEGSPQCTIEVTAEDFQAMLANPNQAMQLFMQGKLKVSGDMMLATKLQSLLAMAGEG